jgi:LacI family transcriptional regulator
MREARPGSNGANAKPTIDDVARLAGVSRTSVSRVLNHGPNVRPALQAKVVEAVEALDFKVNVQARSLAGRAGGEIALVHQSDLDTEPNSYYHAALELGALRACARHGYQMIMRTVSPDAATARKQIEAMFDNDRIAGLIVTPPLSDEPQLTEFAARSGAATVCIAAAQRADTAVPAIGIDEFEAGRDLGRYLTGLGHRRFGYIHGPADHLSALSRFDGLLAALNEAGIGGAIAEERGNFTFHSGIDCAQRVIAGAVRPTVLVCANDDMAAGALLAIHRAGLEIPRDISVTGFDDTPISEIVWPPLTTVHQPIKQIGHDAAELLISLIANDAAGIEHQRRVIANHHLVVRESTAPPPVSTR